MAALRHEGVAASGDWGARQHFGLTRRHRHVGLPLYAIGKKKNKLV